MHGARVGGLKLADLGRLCAAVKNPPLGRLQHQRRQRTAIFTVRARSCAGTGGAHAPPVRVASLRQAVAWSEPKPSPVLWQRAKPLSL
jgi:hypothetical protein